MTYTPYAPYPIQSIDPFAFTDPNVNAKDYKSVFGMEDNIFKANAQILDIAAQDANNIYASRMAYAPMGQAPASMTGAPIAFGGAGTGAPAGSYTIDPATGQQMIVPGAMGQQMPQQGGSGGWQQYLPIAALAGGGLYAAKKLKGGSKLAGLVRAPFATPKSGPGSPGYISWTAPGAEALPAQATGAARFVNPGFINPATGQVAWKPVLGRVGMGALIGQVGAEAINRTLPDVGARAPLAGAAMGAGVGGSIGSIVPGLGTAAGAAAGAGTGAAISYIADAKDAKERGKRIGDVIGLANPMTMPLTLASKIPVIGDKIPDLGDVGGALGGILGFGGGDDEPKKKPRLAAEWLMKQYERGRIQPDEMAALDAERELNRTSTFVDEKGKKRKLTPQELLAATQSSYQQMKQQKAYSREMQRQEMEAQQLLDKMYAPYVDTFIQQGLQRADAYDAYGEMMGGQYAATAGSMAADTRKNTLLTAMAYKQQVQSIPSRELTNQLLSSQQLIAQQQMQLHPGTGAGMFSPAGYPMAAMMGGQFPQRGATSPLMMSAAQARLFTKFGR